MRPKNKQRRKGLKKRVLILQTKSRKQFKFGMIFFLFCGLLVGGAAFSRYHQATNLGDRDSDGIVEGYYLLNTTFEQLNALEKTVNIEKSRKNLRELSAKLSGFGARYADPRLTIEGQRLLNKYYNQMKELGLNLNNQSIESLQEKTTLDNYLQDVEKVKMNQEKAFTYFKVNESALKQKK